VRTLPAHLVALPVLECLAGEPSGVVLGAGATACWVDLGGIVVAVTTREVPLLPNAVALAAGSGSLQRAGTAPGTVARFAPGRIDLGALRVTWDPSLPPVWDPTVPEATHLAPEALARRARALLRSQQPESGPSHGPAAAATTPTDASARAGAAGPDALVGELARVGLPTAADPDGAAGLTRLFRAIRERDPEPAAGAARELLGRGPGLTPEGDDLLAAVAGTLAVLGPAAGWDRPVLAGFLAALAGPAPERTTALSATLLRLAARRQLIEPAGWLLDLGPDAEAAWPAALARLERLGHGSGRAYTAGIAATTGLLASGADDPGRPQST
jgi:Protein of unknown function (DUF2877)